MYKLLMVDDEDVIRRGLQTRVDWTALGFDFLEPCADGRDAMEAVVRCRPDVVVTDIAMPHVDGLQLTTWLAAEHPQVTVLVLSGYDDFEFARTSFRNRVFDYILKPVTAEDLETIFRTLKVRLDQQGKPEPQVRRLLAGEPPSAPGTFSSDLWWQVAVVEAWPRSAAPDLETFESTLAPVVRDSGAFADTQHEGGRSWVTMLFNDSQADRVDRKVRLAAQRVLDTLGRAGWRVVIGVGDPVDAIPGIPGSRADAQSVLGYRLARGAGIYHAHRDSDREVPGTADLEGFPSWFAKAVKAADRAQVESLGAEFLAALPGFRTSGRRLAQDIQAVFTALADLAGDRAGEAPYHIADLAFGPEDLAVHLGDLGVLALEETARGGATLADRKVDEFRDFVARHYHDQELSIHQVSQALAISPSYLSKIVKKKLYRSFVEYITDFRIDLAKELLAGTDLMTYEIAERTGYPDAGYFSSLFKKQTGNTPSEFRLLRRSVP